MNATVIIPARMAAIRFPGKPLVDICGKPMIQWVYERASLAKRIDRVIVATCDEEIARAVACFGGDAVMTSNKHRSGTDRIAEVATNLDADIIVNVQGDEPLIEPDSIDCAVEPFAPPPDPSLTLLHGGSAQGPPCDGRGLGGGGPVVMTSLMVRIDSEAAEDANLVKVVVDQDSFALYFSRSPIPYERNPAGRLIHGHVGLYAYTRDFLLVFASLEPTPLEQTESLEQLRALEHGFRIKMVEIAERPMGVDTQEDLERVRAALSR